MQLTIERGDIDVADFERSKLPNPFAGDLCKICPICQALIRAGYEKVSVVNNALATGHVWGLNEATVNFMAEWDQGFPVHPVTLELDEEA